MNFLELWFGRAEDREEQIGPRPKIIGPAIAPIIAPPPRYVWDERRWRRIEDGTSVQYLGEYLISAHGRSASRSFRGRIVEEPDGIKAYVADPPAAIRQHPKGPCFQLVKAPWFRVHWHKSPPSVDEALLYVERLLDECVNGTRGEP